MKKLSVAGAALAALIVTSLVGAPWAGAATASYAVRVCGDGGVLDSSAFGDLRRSTGLTIGRACFPYAPGVRGLVTMSPHARGRAARNSEASVILRAPRGTALTGINWVGRIKRADCSWTGELYADGARRSRVYIDRLGAFRSCRVRARASDKPYVKRVGLGYRSLIVQRIACRGARGCSRASDSFVQTKAATVTLADVASPSVRILGGGLASGRWVRGVQPVQFTAADNIGVANQALTVDGPVASATTRPCHFSRVVPCPNGPGSLRVDSGRFGDGRHRLAVIVRDPSGHAAAASTTGLFDNHAPPRVAAFVAGGEAWRRSNSFYLLWPSSPERFAPIAAAIWRLCPARGGPCTSGRRVGLGISGLSMGVPAAGDWSLQVWRQDAAGNADPGYASVPVRLRFDPEPPQPAFEAQSFADPTRVSVLVKDAFSGLASGDIELRRQGSSNWQTLATRREGSRLITRIDDASLPAGNYLLRARALDAAGNETTTERRVDGRPMVLTLPLRFDAVLRTGVLATRTIRKIVRRGKRRRVVRRRVTRVLPTVRAPVGRRLAIQGSLTNPDGQPVAGAPIYVYSSTGLVPLSLVGFVTSDASGRFRYIATATSNRALRFVYPGATLIRPTQSLVQVAVPASTSITVNRRRVSNGGAVVFRGRVRTLPAPPGGKLVEMQAFFRGRWRTFSTVRSGRGGRWRFPYRFGGTRGTVRYRFRAVIPVEGGYPFDASRSRTVRVTAHG
jgi:hypothetical protein